MLFTSNQTKKISFILLSVFLGILIALSLFELYLRLIKYPGKIYDIDTDTGLLHLIPNREFIYMKSCFKAYVKTNAQGFNSPNDYKVEKEKNELRIVVLGDSYVEGFQVDQGKRFFEILEQKLKKDFPEIKITVYNFGRSGNGRLMNLLYFQNYGFFYKPDLVIDLFISNDIKDDNCKEREQSFYGKLRPCIVLNASGELDYEVINKQLNEIKNIKNSFNYKIKLFVGEHFKVVDFIYKKLKEIKEKKEQEKLIKSGGMPPDYYIFLQTYPQDWKQAWEEEKVVIKELKGLAEKTGAIYVLVSGTDGFRVHDDLKAQLPQNWIEKFDFDKPEKMLSSIAKEIGINYIPLLYEFRNRAKEKTVFPCDGHWNEYGHRLAGEILYEELIKNSKIKEILEKKKLSNKGLGQN